MYHSMEISPLFQPIITAPIAMDTFHEETMLQKAFTVALLLTGSEALAESAVVEGLSRIREVSEDTLLASTVAAALVTEAEEAVTAFAFMPVELARVMRLRGVLRQAFVLRILLGWTAARCARLLKRESESIDSDACVALQQLSSLPLNQ